MFIKKPVKLNGILPAALILISGILAYSNTFNAPFYLDDYPSIVNNLAIRNIFNLRSIWDFWPTRFITYLSFSINYHFSRLNAFSYHFFNLLIHLISALLVWRFVLITLSTPQLEEEKTKGYADYIAIFAGLVFAIHPIQTQGVTYIVQRASALTALFCLISIILYAKSRILEVKGSNHAISKMLYLTSFIALLLAMFSKEIAIAFPLVILCYEYSFFRDDRRKRLFHLLPFFASLLVIPITMLFTESVDFITLHRFSDDPAGIPPLHYLFTQFKVIITYLRLIFVPVNQNLDYYYPVARSIFDNGVMLSMLLLAVISIFTIKIFRKFRFIAFGIAWFFVALLPESSLVPIKDVIFEHRLYLPMVGFCLVLSGLVYLAIKKKAVKVVLFFMVAIVFFLAISTFKRNAIWADEVVLWDDVIKKSPLKARPYNNRGVAYSKRGDIARAFSDYSKAIGLDGCYSDAYNNRALLYAKQGNSILAVYDYDKAIFFNPQYANAYHNRGVSYYQLGDYNKAISDFTEAIRINHSHYQAYHNRGVVYSHIGDSSQAHSDYDKAISIDAYYAQAYYSRAKLYFTLKEYNNAWVDLRRAEELGYKVNSSKFIKDLQKVSGRFR